VSPNSEYPKLITRVISFELTQHIRRRYINVTDGRTDMQTDGQFTIAILHFALRPSRHSRGKKLKDIRVYSSSWEPISVLSGVTCRMGSYSITCHPTQVNAPRLNPNQPGLYSIYLPRSDRRLSWPRCLTWDGLTVHRQSPIRVVTRPGVEQLPWSSKPKPPPLPPSGTHSFTHCRWTSVDYSSLMITPLCRVSIVCRLQCLLYFSQ